MRTASSPALSPPTGSISRAGERGGDSEGRGIEVTRIGGWRSQIPAIACETAATTNTGRPAEQHDAGDAEDEAEVDAARVDVLDGNRIALRDRRCEQQREDADDRRRGVPGPRERDRRRDEDGSAGDANGRYYREEARR